MSTATKRGKLLPDLLIAREALLPSISPSPGRDLPYADLDPLARSRAGVLKWVLVKRVDDAAEGRAASGNVLRPLNSNVPARQRRANDGKRGPAAPSSKLPAEGIFCEKGDATPAVARPWCWDYEDPGETSLKGASYGRRAKSKARQSSP